MQSSESLEPWAENLPDGQEEQELDSEESEYFPAAQRGGDDFLCEFAPRV